MTQAWKPTVVKRTWLSFYLSSRVRLRGRRGRVKNTVPQGGFGSIRTKKLQFLALYRMDFSICVFRDPSVEILTATLGGFNACLPVPSKISLLVSFLFWVWSPLEIHKEEKIHKKVQRICFCSEETGITDPASEDMQLISIIASLVLFCHGLEHLQHSLLVFIDFFRHGFPCISSNAETCQMPWVVPLNFLLFKREVWTESIHLRVRKNENWSTKIMQGKRKLKHEHNLRCYWHSHRFWSLDTMSNLSLPRVPVG